jgi:hypothetical protein
MGILPGKKTYRSKISSKNAQPLRLVPQSHVISLFEYLINYSSVIIYFTLWHILSEYFFQESSE